MVEKVIRIFCNEPRVNGEKIHDKQIFSCIPAAILSQRTESEQREICFFWRSLEPAAGEERSELSERKTKQQCERSLLFTFVNPCISQRFFATLHPVVCFVFVLERVQNGCIRRFVKSMLYNIRRFWKCSNHLCQHNISGTWQNLTFTRARM